MVTGVDCVSGAIRRVGKSSVLASMLDDPVTVAFETPRATSDIRGAPGHLSWRVRRSIVGAHPHEGPGAGAYSGNAPTPVDAGCRRWDRSDILSGLLLQSFVSAVLCKALPEICWSEETDATCDVKFLHPANARGRDGSPMIHKENLLGVTYVKFT